MNDFFGEIFFLLTLEILLKNFNMLKIDRLSRGESRFLTNLTKLFISDDPVMSSNVHRKTPFLDIWQIGCNSLIYDYYSIKKIAITSRNIYYLNDTAFITK